jgi:hypothetical protein
MAQMDTPSSVLPNIFTPEIARMGKDGFETFAAAQQEVLKVLEQANRDWFARINEEAGLVADFAKKLTAAKSIPDAASAYQEMMTQQMQLLTKAAQKLLDDAPHFVGACTRIMGNGKGVASS